MTDSELQEYFALMKAEVLMLPVDAFVADDFMEAYEEGRKGKLTRLWDRIIRRIPLPELWHGYSGMVKANLYPDKSGHAHLKAVEFTIEKAEEFCREIKKKEAQIAKSSIQGGAAGAGAERDGAAGGSVHKGSEQDGRAAQGASGRNDDRASAPGTDGGDRVHTEGGPKPSA